MFSKVVFGRVSGQCLLFLIHQSSHEGQVLEHEPRVVPHEVPHHMHCRDLGREGGREEEEESDD